MPHRGIVKYLMMTLLLLALAGCAEVDTLRQRTAQQDEVIKRLQKENSDFQAAYYEIKEKIDSQNATSAKTVDQMQRDLDQAKNLKTQQEKELGDQLRTRNLEYEALKTEAADQKKTFDTQITQLQQASLASQAARDSALTTASQAAAQLKAEQTRAQGLEQQIAQLTANVKSLTDQSAALQKDMAARDQALQAEKDAHAQTQAKVAEIQQQLTQAQGQAADLKTQLSAAAATSLTLETAQKENADLRGQLEQLKTAHAQELEKTKADAQQQVAKAVKEVKPPSLADDPDLAEAAQKIGQSVTGVKARADGRGLRIIIPDKLLFDENSTIMAERAGAVLAPVAGVLKGLTGRPVRIEGHTDNQPVQDLPFADNWGLGFARADRVRDYLMKDGGLSGERLTALSKAQFDPLAGNDTPEGRAQNRRVEIVVGAKSE